MEPVTIQIPNTIDEALAELDGIGRFITAKGWHRAALVYAFVEPRLPNNVGGKPANLRRLSANAFAGYGIHGLRTADSVLAHWRNWDDAINQGFAVDPRPGDIVEVPAGEYPSTAKPATVRDNLLDNTPPEQKYEAVKEVLRRAPEVAERIEKDYEHQFIQKAARDTDLSSKVFRAYEEHHPEPVPAPRPTGDLHHAMLYEFGGLIYAGIQRQQDALSRLVSHLEQHGFQERDRVHFDHLMGTLEKSRHMIADIEDRVSRAAGVDYDEVFRRLVNG